MPLKNLYSVNGTEILFLPGNSFTTTLVSFNFYMPLNKETVSQYALLPEIMVTCSKDYPDYLKLNYKLSSLYGADVVASSSKVGNCICIKFTVSSINDKYAFDGQKVTKESIDLLLSLIFRPKTENNAFFGEDLKREKRKLIDRIKGEVNEKRTFARNRLTSEMFEDDPFGLYKLGDIQTVSDLSGEDLFEAWNNMLSRGYLKIHVIGEEMPEGLKEGIIKELSAFNRETVTDIYEVTSLKERSEVKEVTDYFDVAQGKLVMGFSCPGGDDDSSLDVMLMNDIFGGGPYARLFTNVREKMSLCYYCSSQAVRNKGFMMVDSGVEKENAEKAKEAILGQLEIMKKGEFSDFEFSSAVKSIKDSLRSYNDSQNGLDVWYTLKAINKNVYSPEEISEKIEKITRQDVIDAANRVKLNTVYMLLPKEKEGV